MIRRVIPETVYQVGRRWQSGLFDSSSGPVSIEFNRSPSGNVKVSNWAKFTLSMFTLRVQPVAPDLSCLCLVGDKAIASTLLRDVQGVVSRAEQVLRGGTMFRRSGDAG